MTIVVAGFVIGLIWCLCQLAWGEYGPDGKF
jgi:hypothetical protein